LPSNPSQPIKVIGYSLCAGKPFIKLLEASAKAHPPVPCILMFIIIRIQQRASVTSLVFILILIIILCLSRIVTFYTLALGTVALVVEKKCNRKNLKKKVNESEQHT